MCKCVPLSWSDELTILYSLVPRFPHSGTRTLKLCRRGEPGIYSHVRSSNRQTRGRRHLNCVWAYVTQNRKRNEGSGQLTTCI